ncbi:MAG TPA: hypothetical protein VN694_03305 [Caulobacteraceae bacterium]|nr:hypothetical protein [Caulobacteraceae bacterium]
MTNGRRAALAATATLSLVAGLAGAAHAATPAANLFYERALMAAAGQACRLFAPDVSVALSAAKAQARGAALRSGADAAALSGLEAQADAAGASGCRSPDILAAAVQVRSAFAGYAALSEMKFPGELSSWTASRPATDGWRVVQRDRFGWDVMLFGVAGHGPERPLIAAASFADGAQPYAARIVLRDTALTSGPYLDAREADIAGRLPIDARMPPRSATRVFTAEATAPAGVLQAPDMPGAVAFRFPAAAADALAGLDPREAVAVEFLFAGEHGDAVRTAYVEVGDFAAARAFQAVAQVVSQR